MSKPNCDSISYPAFLRLSLLALFFLFNDFYSMVPMASASLALVTYHCCDTLEGVSYSYCCLIFAAPCLGKMAPTSLSLFQPAVEHCKTALMVLATEACD
jgi:hypothetical protein